VTRTRVALRGAGVVQGVGLRPAVLRAALRAGVAGLVRNAGGALWVEAEGDAAQVEAFVAAVTARVPGAGWSREARSPQGDAGFVIAESDAGDAGGVPLPPDTAPCADCLAEVMDAGSRRAGYAFTSCTRCGPRWTVAHSAPWDRARTSMAPFVLCAACRAEYDAVDDRRAHAQTLACPACGPSLWWRGAEGEAVGDAALAAAVALLRAGGVLALKGVGGWQLLVDATDEAAVTMLRARKGRPAKPFAVLLADLDAAAVWCVLDDAARRCLVDPAAPVVLVPSRGGLAPAVAPGLRYTGAMLPASPLHTLVARAAGRPLVCTSGNRADEPLCADDAEALTALAGVADGWLGHTREIVRALDDSVVRPTRRGPVVLRRARGLVPRAIVRRGEGPVVLGVGAHLKATVTLALCGEYLVSEHVGDLSSAAARDRLAATARDLVAWTGARPDAVACDLHPDLGSTHLAEALAGAWGVPCVRVQHHAAHVAAVAAEHGRVGDVAGFAWDGMGLGDDGTLWGGELLAWQGGKAHSLGHLRPFRLPGGDAAARDGRRAALGLLDALRLDTAPATGRFDASTATLLQQAMRRGVNAPWTRSVGRFLEAMAALLGVADRSRYEGEAATLLEQSCLDAPDEDGAYAVAVEAGPSGLVIDPRPWVVGALDDVASGLPVQRVASRLHNTLAAAAAQWARAAGLDAVVLSGGCFHNLRLLEGVTASLARVGVTALRPHVMPAGDGAISLGQCEVASRRLGASPGGREGL
jgi:hydrogenase maturation protein HypF